MASTKKPGVNSKRPRDIAQLARSIVLESAGEAPRTDPPPEKDPAAVELGRKGGKSRARRMTPEQRSEAAKRAAKARWPNS